MFRTPSRRLRSSSGSSLIPTLMIVTVVVTFVSLAGAMTSQFSRMASMHQGNDEALAGADSALEYAYSFWKKQVKANGNTAPTNAYLRTKAGGTNTSSNATTSVDLTSLASGSANFSATGTTLAGLTILAVDADGDVVSPNGSGTLDGQNTQNVPGYPGWAGRTYYYKAEATVRSSRFGVVANSGVKVTRYFQLTNVPLFQAAIFYENKLEIYPGADMNVTGLVHTNADIWAQPFSTAITLQFKSNVSHIGGFNESSQTGEARNGWAGGTTNVNGNAAYFAAAAAKNTWSDGLLTNASATKATQLNQVSAIDPFGGASQTNNGLRRMIQPPDTNDTSNQKVANNATVIITINSALTASDANRVVVTGGNGASLNSNDIANLKAALTPAPPAIGTGAVIAPPTTTGTSNGVIYDQREQSTVYLTDVNMVKLQRAVAGKDPATGTAVASTLAGNYNGVVYIRDTAATTVDSLTGLSEGNHAIRLKNGANLSSTGTGTAGVDVTIGSENAVYIQGDFNVGTGTVPSNSSYNASTAATDHYASNYQRASCAVMADAVTVLSNSFQDSRSNNLTDFTNRIATPTTVNCAVLAGDVPTNRKDPANPSGNGYASGGAHNFPRFLEDWTNVNFTYWGSLVEAFRSERAVGVWKTGNVYHWPNRRWSFDTQFLTRAPRGTPQGVQFARGRWERASL